MGTGMISLLHQRAARLAGTQTQRPLAGQQSFATAAIDAGGMLAALTISQVSPGRKNRLWFEIDGARQSRMFDQEEPERLWLGSQDAVQLLVKDPQRGASEQRRLVVLPAGHVQGYDRCFEAFVADAYAAMQALASQSADRPGERLHPPEGLPTFADGVRSARLVEAVLRSAREGDWTEV